MVQPNPDDIRDLVEAALAIDPSGRRAFIMDACHGDEALSDEVFRVLQRVTGEIASGVVTSSTTIASERHDAGIGASPDPPTTVAEFEGTARFKVLRRIGSGGFGTVFEALDRESKRSVALKVLRRLEFVDRFKREFRALAEIRHPNLIVLHELFAQPTWFFTMEFVRGVNILHYVRRRVGADDSIVTTCDFDRLRPAVLQLAAGINALHAVGIHHRDIKPGNILVSHDGRVRLLDFGLIRETERYASDTTLWAGTPGYLAPEQLARRPAHRASDWYALGVVLHQALVGSMPSAAFLQSVANHTVEPSAFPATIPAEWATLCADLLRANPDDRIVGDEVIRRLAADAAPAPAIATRSDFDTLVGRDAQLTLLRGLFARLGSSETVVVNLHGHSGVGKSTLLRTFRRQLQREPGVVVLDGRCHQNETVPYKALDDLVDGLAHYLRSLRDSEVESLTPHDVMCLGRTFPVLARVDGLHRVRRKEIDILDARELRDRGFASLCDLLTRLAEKRLLVIAIDDLQWGDLDSVAFLSKLLTDGNPPSLMLIGSYRSEDRATSPFLQQWTALLRTASAITIRDVGVEPLRTDQAAALAEQLLKRFDESGQDLARTIAVESSGSPFLVEQLAGYFTAAGESNGRATIGEMIDHRLSMMPPLARRLLECVSVAGEPIPTAVANAAAGIDRHDATHQADLVNERFLRMRETPGSKEIEVYHHRISEAIVGGLPPSERRNRHLALAEALAAEERPRAALVATHFHSAGDIAAATTWSLTAAEQAFRALAFDRAAHWFELALNLHAFRSDQEVAIRRQYADALVNAGRSVRAADEFLTAARYAAPTESAELRRLAAEQLLRAGDTTTGLDLLQTLAHDVGVWLPATRWQMLASFAWQRLKLALFGTRVPERGAGSAAEQQITRLDVYWSLVIGFVTLDATRSIEFQSRHLLLALRVGDRDHMAIALAAEAAYQASLMKRNTERISRLLADAHRLSAETTHPKTGGVVATFEALAALVAGEFSRAKQLAETAKPILLERCTGVAWEVTTTALIRATAAVHLGEWSTLEDPLAILTRIEDSVVRRDSHAIYAASSGAHVSTLAINRPDVGIQIANRLQASLPNDLQNKYLLPHLWLLEGRADLALYSGDARTAWMLVEKEWPAFSRSLHVRLDYAAVVAQFLRGRTAVAIAANAADPSDYVVHARAAIGALENRPALWAGAFATIVRAGVSSVIGRRDEAIELLREAERRSADASMSHCVAACRYRLGSLVGGARGTELTAAAEEWARRERVVQPRKMFDVFFPGRWDSLTLDAGEPKEPKD